MRESTLSALSSQGKNNNIKNHQLRANPTTACKHFNTEVISSDPKPQTTTLPLRSSRPRLHSQPSLGSLFSGEAARRVPGLRPLGALDPRAPKQASEPSSPQPPLKNNIKDETQQIRKASQKPSAVLTRGSNLRRAVSIKDLISKFGGPEQDSSPQSPSSGSPKSAFAEVPESPKSKLSPTTQSSGGQYRSPVPSISVTPPSRQTSQNGPESAQNGNKSNQITARIDCPVGGSTEKSESEAKRKTQTSDSGRESVADSGMGSESEFDTNKQPESLSEDEPTTPRPASTSQNPKYQLFLNNEMKTNGVGGRDANSPGGGGPMGENGPRLARWETSRLGNNHFRGSLECLASRDWDNSSDRVGIHENAPRVFNSPYSTSMDYNPSHRMSEFKK
ncbi:uncharacterized protein LKV04_015103 [Tautogolabrus adspersus]